MTAIDGECEYDGQIKNNDLTYTREEDKYAQGIGGDTRTIFGKEYRSLSSALCNFLNSPVTSSLLGPNTLLNTPFSNTLSLRSSLNFSDQVSHPYRTTGNIIILYRVSQERTKLREGVPYVKLYRYNPKHLYPKLNGYGDNGKRSLKV